MLIYWQANEEFDLQGYNLYYGTATRQYADKQITGCDTLALVKDLQEKTEYYFALSAFDAAGNESGYSEEFVCIINDTRPLLVESVTAISRTDVLIRFNKKINPAAAQRAANYAIDGEITIFRAQVVNNGNAVRLVTSPHKLDTGYNLTINNIMDISLPANELENNNYSYLMDGRATDHTCPTVTLVAADSADKVIVYFNESVNPASATNLLNYTISDQISIISAAMYADNAVSLHTSAHEAGRVYSITVTTITDLANTPNSIPDNSVYSYSWQPEDLTGPVIILAHSPAPDKLDILFSEPLQKDSDNPANFRIDHDVQVLSAQLDSSREIIHLQTTAHIPGRDYVLNAGNIADATPSGYINPAGLQYTYQYTPDDILSPYIKTVTVLDETHINIYFSEQVDRKSAEQSQNYIISNGVQVLTSTIALSDDHVTLTTTPHHPDLVYTLDVAGVQDRSLYGNEMTGSCPFKYSLSAAQITTGALLLSAEIPDAMTLKITFNKALNRASAEDINRYSINDGPAILSATLTDSLSTVQLTTAPHKAGQLYTLVASGIYPQIFKDETVIEDNLISYCYQESDHSGPYIIQAKAVAGGELQVLFSEPVERSGAENVENYQISGNIPVLSASLDGSKRIICLQTGQHQQGVPYTLRVTQITDDSPAGNACPDNIQYTYIYTPADETGPFVRMVRTIGPELLQVHFSETLDSADALITENYRLNNNGEILAAHAGVTDNIIELTISPLDSGLVYSLQVSGVRDLAGNMVTALNNFIFMYYPAILSGLPQLTGLTINNADEVLLNYDRQVIPEIAGNLNNYNINRQITIFTAQLQPPNQVLLNTGFHAEKASYVLETLASGNEQLLTPYPYSVAGNGNHHLAITTTGLLCADMLQITFNYPVDENSAANIINYHIAPVGSVLSANVEADKRTVILTTSAHIEGIPYTVKVTDVYTSGMHGAASPPLYANYTCLPSLGIYVRSLAKTSIDYLQPGKEYYTDSHYVTTAIPEGLVNSRIIKTPNNDKNNSSDDYLSLILTTDAMVYIAYDSRVKKTPDWLTRFTKTGKTLGVSESGGKMDLWASIFPAGEIILGGNNAGGAVDAKSMYVVIISGIDPDLYEKGVNPEKNKNNQNPHTFILYQNHPNPFNPETTIPFEIATEMVVKLEIFDILGRRVKTLLESKMPAGYHRLIWDGSDELGNTVATGVYFYRFEQNAANTEDKHSSSAMVKKMLFVK
ncbi:MAG TPA: FlgD immunoglobulin-like domain containing protein [bacterium]|nr:FlgD immunoglobulin-like domain containing protein [bacterium]HPN45236.1 FlgD immunoglobulin-like domain containing protein [bacterium]